MDFHFSYDCRRDFHRISSDLHLPLHGFSYDSKAFDRIPYDSLNLFLCGGVFN